MSEAFIVAACRTAGGRRNGRLAGWHPVDLGAAVINDLVARTDSDPALIEDVILGCVGQAGEQSQNMARNVVLASVLPESVPATTVDRQCGSSQQALHFAAQAVMSGVMDVVIAGGVENMTRVPMFSPSTLAERAGMGTYVSPWMTKRYPGIQFSQFTGAERVAIKYDISKEALDEYSYQSHLKAAQATHSGAFKAEIVPVAIDSGGSSHGLHDIDEGIRFDASLEAIRSVKLLSRDGRLTAASASQICDGASAALIVSAAGLKVLRAEPIARIHHMSVLGHDPVIMLEAPIPATERALRKAGMQLGDIDLFEVNEAFASIPLAWLKATGTDPERLNVHGGAIALGHPLGASGARLLATLVHALRKRGGRYGLQTMCEGGGMANVTIVERL
jgi:acetyl-CoA C-acetyltransferase